MTAKHTPGPWRFCNSPTLIRYIHGPDNRVLATAENIEDGKNNEAKRLEADANAHLIAAAPALLAALEDAEFLLRKAGINPKEAEKMADSFKRSAEDARAAIAAAKGKE